MQSGIHSEKHIIAIRNFLERVAKLVQKLLDMKYIAAKETWSTNLGHRKLIGDMLEVLEITNGYYAPSVSSVPMN